jgi:hypothetical protein
MLIQDCAQPAATGLIVNTSEGGRLLRRDGLPGLCWHKTLRWFLLLMECQLGMPG